MGHNHIFRLSFNNCNCFDQFVNSHDERHLSKNSGKIIFKKYLSSLQKNRKCSVYIKTRFNYLQKESDIEWKKGRTTLIRNMHRATASPPPINLLTTGSLYMYHKYKGNCCLNYLPRIEFKRKKTEPPILLIISIDSFIFRSTNEE